MRNPDQVGTHVGQNTKGRRSAIDGRTTRHARYAVSQRIQKRVEAIFGWMKPVLSGAEGTVGRFHRSRYRELDRTGLPERVTTSGKMARTTGGRMRTKEHSTPDRQEAGEALAATLRGPRETKKTG